MCITILRKIIHIGGLLLIMTAQASAKAGDLPVIPLPKGEILAATIARGTNWYTMGGEELRCLKKILARKRSFPDLEEHGHINIPTDYIIIIWRAEKDKLIPADMLSCSANVLSLFPFREAGFYELDGVKEREPLRKLMTRIDQGLEQPIAVRKVELPEKGREKE